ncbi:hypothetical protein LA080_015775 [Diaporthe eres]|nr:hypothetical protein LA080_015775 [Diaporthe eres]
MGSDDLASIRSSKSQDLALRRRANQPRDSLGQGLGRAPFLFATEFLPNQAEDLDRRSLKQLCPWPRREELPEGQGMVGPVAWRESNDSGSIGGPMLTGDIGSVRTRLGTPGRGGVIGAGWEDLR